MIELQRCNDKARWDDTILGNGGHPLQLWSWGQVKAESGWRVERFFGAIDGTIVAAAQVLIRRLPYPFVAFAYIPRGPLVLESAVDLSPRAVDSSSTAVDSSPEVVDLSPEVVENDFLNSLASFVKRQHKAIVLSVEPDEEDFVAPKGWLKSPNKILPADTILLDLKLSESELLARMAKKTRQYIRKSAPSITVKLAKNQTDLKKCLSIYKDTARRAGFNLHSDQYYLNVFNKLEEYSPVFIAYNQLNEPIAFLWLAISAKTAYELYGGVNEEGQELRANYALKWQAIQKVKGWGLERYDFGGMVAGGVATFKHGWSDSPTNFAGTFDKPLSPLYKVWTKGLPTVKKFLQRIHRKA